MKFILIHKINKFYHIFWEALNYDFEPHICNFDNDFLLQVLYDINEALEANSNSFHEEAYALDRWLNNLRTQIIDYREKITQKILGKIFCAIAILLVVWGTYSCAEVLLKHMSNINFFSVISEVI